jgi:tetratricopeptide (TPR) repeat protein
MHLLKEYRNAIELYTMAAALDKKSPLALYHLSDCYIQIQDKLAALVALELVVKRAENNPAHQVIKDRAVMTLKSLRKDLEEAGVLNKVK